MRTIADYTITREIGRGGMGAVYHALSPDGATVAVKTVLWPDVVDPRARWEAIERFQREARAARSLSHPNICHILDFGADQDSLYIIMEFLDGQTVAQLIDLAGKIEPHRAVQIVREVADALAHAHDKGIVHRDVKPANIIVLRTGQVKLTDFGVASVLHETAATRTGGTTGTVYYMSPEQIRGEKLDARSDIFSLGATLYEMVAGTRPFQGETYPAVIHQILNEQPPPVEDAPTVRVSHIVERCLQKQPQKRFQSARELIDSLRTVETDRALAPTATIGGPKPGPVVRGRRRVVQPLRALRRWPALVVVAAVLIVGALVVLRPPAPPGAQPATTEVTPEAPATSQGEAMPPPDEPVPGPGEASQRPKPPPPPETPGAKEAGARENATAIDHALSGPHPMNKDLTGADLANADLRRSDLMLANLTNANLRRANLTAANLTAANLVGADLTGADLSGATLWTAAFTGANLSGANLTGAALLGAVNLQDATFSEETTLPDGTKWRPGVDLSQFTQPYIGPVVPGTDHGRLPPTRH